MALSDLPKKPNILYIITDQQTWIQEWDPEWAKENLPAMNRLLKNGLAFNKAQCNSCTCSPSRATLFTGTYPAHHKVTQVLEYDDPNNPKQTGQKLLPGNYQTMAKMMAADGYNVVYKGKFHINKPTQFFEDMPNGSANDERNKVEAHNYVTGQLYWSKDDVKHIEDRYGFKEWNYPDAGDDAAVYNFGGGNYNNDGRFVDGYGRSARYEESIPIEERIEASAVNYIETYKENYKDQPFFMVVSLVNPHDVLSYPGTGIAAVDGVPRYQYAGYEDSAFDKIKVKLPKTLNEILTNKPKVQQKWLELCQAVGPINTEDEARKYLQFYAYLTSVVDKEIEKVLNALDKAGLTEDTLIVRLSDHGDMAMAHGMQRQKMYNVYRETLNVPMIFSNPIAFPKAETTDALAGLIDLMPTIAEIVGIPQKHWIFQGKSLKPVLDKSKDEVQDYLHFTYDDDYAITPNPQKMGATHIRCIVEKEWKYAVYFDPNYGNEIEYEMYHIAEDPLETRNLAHAKFSSPTSRIERQRLHKKLSRIMSSEELGTMPDSIIWPEVSGELQ